MSVEIHAIVESETKGSRVLQIYNKDEELILGSINREDNGTGDLLTNYDLYDWSNKKSEENRILLNYSINTVIGSNIIKNILEGNIQGALDIIKQNLDIFYYNSLLQIKISNLSVLNVRQLGQQSKKGIRIKNYMGKFKDVELSSDKLIIPDTKSFIKAETLLSKYRVFGVCKRLPYINYDINSVSNDVNCFYNYIDKHFKKASKKEKNKFNKNDGVVLNEIIEFADKYKVKCILYNIVGRLIYKNEYTTNKSYPAIIAMISNGHFYPQTNSHNNHKPELNVNKINGNDFDECFDLDDQIVYIKNNKQYTSKGCSIDNKINEYEIDNILFKGLKPNFNYNNDLILINSFMYSDSSIKNTKYEYDINKAYFNVAYSILEGDYPIFTCFDLWEKYEDEVISPVYYYSIREKALHKLACYGINNNFRTGLVIEFLINNKLIKKKDIEYFKKPSYLGCWNDVKLRLDKLVDNIVKRKLNKDNDHVITEEDIKESGIDKQYVFYNGLLGKYKYSSEEQLYYLNESEYDLLNFGLNEEQWTYSGSKDKCIYKKSRSFFKNLNNTTIYNQIVEMTNLVLLKNIVYINKNQGVMPLKIKTDAIGYEVEVKLSDEFPSSLFKIISMEKVKDKTLLHKKEKIFTGISNVKVEYNNIKKILETIKDNELSKISSNISFHGPPGTGKTHEILNNHSYDKATTITNVCALNISTDSIKADTIYSLLKMYDPDKWYDAMKKLMNKTVWIDEYSMINRNIWNFFLLLCMNYRCKLIITGDLNQISPINETKINKDNYVFNCIMGKQKLLTKDFRNDREIIQLRNYILNENMTTLYSKFKKISSDDDQWIKYDRHLTFTNNAKNYINNKILESRKLIFKFNYIKKNNKNEYQSLEVSEGVILSCRETVKNKNIFKRDLWKVMEKTQFGYKLLNLRNNITNYFLMCDMIYFCLGFAMTTHSAQGLTITDDLCVHEIKKMIYMDKEILYTAVTRAKEYKKLHLFYDTKFDNIKEEYLPNIKDFDEDDKEYDFGQKLKCI